MLFPSVLLDWFPHRFVKKLGTNGLKELAPPIDQFLSRLINIKEFSIWNSCLVNSTKFLDVKSRINFEIYHIESLFCYYRCKILEVRFLTLPLRIRINLNVRKEKMKSPILIMYLSSYTEKTQCFIILGYD